MFTKKMIALLVLATILVSGAALAEDGYKVYGKLHTSIDYMNNSEDSQIMMANNTSRFGFKGSKELNEKCTFIWQFESAINLAQKGTNTLVTRNSFLGLTGDWGTFLYGIHDTPFKTVGRKATFFYDELADHRQMTMGWDRRLQDVVVYASPSFSGISVVGGYMLDQGVIGAEEGTTAYSVSAAYKKEGMYFGVAFEGLSTAFSANTASDTTYTDIMDDNGAVIGSFISDISDTPDGTYGEDQTGIRAGLKYDFGSFAVAGMFQALSNYKGAADVSAQTLGLEAKFNINDMYSVKTAYYMADPNTDTDDDDFGLFALGFDRNMGQKTYMYIQYAMVMNGDASMAALGGPGHGASITPTEAGESPTGISFGMVTKF